MLRASLLANAEILPQARQESYFFNRIGRLLPVARGGKRPIAATHGFLQNQGHQSEGSPTLNSL